MKKILAVLTVAVVFAFAAPAFAANPFMDVPAGHWAYDAVEQLAARGIVSGYPDGAYKGPQPATRYEVAAIVARALARIDMSKAGRQDLEMLKKLVIEFKDELDALGVKVDKLDKRVAVLEKGLGGWTITGEFRLDARFEGEEAPNNLYSLSNNRDRDFNMSRYRLHFTKQIDGKTYFYGRLNDQDANWNRYFVNTVLPWDIEFRVGRFNIDWEDELGLYVDDDATFGDFNATGFQFTKNFGGFGLVAVVARDPGFQAVNNDTMLYAVRLGTNFGEKFRIGGMFYYFDGDQDVNYDNLQTWGVYAGYDFTPAITLQGVYYGQDFDPIAGPDSDGDSWKAQLILRQDLLKFTSLWLEYGQQDAGFRGNPGFGAYGADPQGQYAAAAGVNPGATFSYFFIRADQQWTDKFSTFERYFQTDLDTNGFDDTKNWTVGIKYQYTPAMSFELAYDDIDYGTNIAGNNGDDHLIRFRTYVKF